MKLDYSKIFEFRSEPQEGKFILCHGVALHRNQLLPSFGEWIDVIHGFSSQVHTVNIDISAFSCLCALILFRTNGKFQTPKMFKNLIFDQKIDKNF